MEKRESQEKLGTMPVGKLLAVMSLPMMISMLVQALYNAVDAMFVARVSEDALTAVSLAFPFQNVMIAVGVGSGVAGISVGAAVTGTGVAAAGSRASTAGSRPQPVRESSAPSPVEKTLPNRMPASCPAAA